MLGRRGFGLSFALLASTAWIAPVNSDPPARETIRFATPPGADWETLKGVLSDGKLDASDAVDVSVAAVWSAIGNGIGDARMCRLAQLAAMGAPPRTFSINATIANGDESVGYEQSYLVTYTPNAVLYAPIHGRDAAGNLLTGQPIRACPKPAGLEDWPPEANGQRGSMVQDPTQGFLGLAWHTEFGKVRIVLPDDMRAGDRISGTVLIEPAGATDQERYGNSATLEGHVIEIDGQRTRVGQGKIALAIGAGAAVIGVALRDAAGMPVGQGVVPLNPLQPPLSLNPQVPQAAAMGEPLSIPGNFDGNAANTQVSLNGAAMEVIAESPRVSVIQCPPDVTGPARISATDAGTTATASTNLIGVMLSAPRTRLMRGERTELTMQVAGLQGLNQPINITLTASPNVRLEGGNRRTIMINPRRADANGVHTSRYRLTSTAPGAFEVTAVYVVKRTSGSMIWY